MSRTQPTVVGRSPTGRGLPVVAAVLLLTVLVAVGAPAAAAADSNTLLDVPRTGVDGSLYLQTSQLPLVVPALNAGESFSWQVAAKLADHESSDLWVGLVSSGTWAAVDGYQLTAQLCSAPWVEADGLGTHPTCPSGPATLIDRNALADISTLPLSIGQLTPSAPQFVSFTIDLPADSALSTETGELSIEMEFTASGADEHSDPAPFPVDISGSGQPRSGSLSWTGFDLLPFAGFGVGAILLGLAIAGLARRARRGPAQ